MDRSTNREVFLFVAIACLLSWSLWVPTIASQRGWIEAAIPVMPWGSFGPALSAVVLAAFRPGELRTIFARLGAWRVRPVWYLAAIGAPLAAQTLAIAVASFSMGHSPDWHHLDRLYLAAPLFLLVLVIGGPLGEEIGWRGYALPRLLSRRGPAASSGLIAVAWLLWHLPLFWLEGAAQAGSSIVRFALLVAASSVLFTWMYLRTNGSLLMAILFHTGINFATWGSSLVAPDATEHSAAVNTLMIVAVGAAIAVCFGWLGRRPVVAEVHVN